MAEYIEKAELMSLIESEAHRWGDDYDWWQCLADIEDFKPAYVRPVRRGRWIKVSGFFTPGGDPVWECSECKKGRHVYGTEHSTYGADISDCQWVACPNCGADMREVEEDG